MKQLINKAKHVYNRVCAYAQMAVPYLFWAGKRILWPFTWLAHGVGLLLPKRKPRFIVNRPLQVKRCSAWRLMLRGMNPHVAFLHQDASKELGRRKYPVVTTTIQRSKRFAGWEYVTSDGDQAMLFPEDCLETLVVTSEEAAELDEMVYKQHAEDIKGIVNDGGYQGGV